MRFAFSLIAAALLVNVALAQEDKNKKKVEEPFEPMGITHRLPPPLNRITGNVVDFENEGFFSVTSARVGKVGNENKDALIWTLKTKKQINCRHALRFLNRLRDVRFYHVITNSPREGVNQSLVEKHWTLLYYDYRLTPGAANRKFLARDDLIHVWIYLDPAEIRRFHREDVKRIKFSPYKG